MAMRCKTPYWYSALVLVAVLLLAGCGSSVRFSSADESHTAGSMAARNASPGRYSPGSGHASIVGIAEQWLGTPYLYGGEDADGIDCSALMVHVFNRIGVDLPRTSRSQFDSGTPVERPDLLVGDLVFFDTKGDGVSHVGMYIGNGQFIHAASSTGVVRESLDTPYYRRRYIGARRILAAQ